MGQKVKTIVNQNQLAGEYRVVWDGKNDRNESVACGIYFYQLYLDQEVLTRRMMLIK